MTQKLRERNIFVTIGANFTKIRSDMYLGLEVYRLSFWIKRFYTHPFAAFYFDPRFADLETVADLSPQKNDPQSAPSFRKVKCWQCFAGVQCRVAVNSSLATLRADKGARSARVDKSIKRTNDRIAVS